MFSVIIPVYNEERTIRCVIERALKTFERDNFEIIVVDDHSTDGSFSIIKDFKNSIKIIRHKKNKGKGGAIITGLRESKGEYIGIQDADMEYNMEELKILFFRAKRYNLKAIFGSRFKKKNKVIYPHYLLGNITMAIITSILFGKFITDPYTCYKIIKADLFKSLNLKSKRFEIEAEITGKILKRKIKIFEFPVSYKPRRLKEGKKIRFVDAIKGFLTLIKIRFSK